MRAGIVLALVVLASACSQPSRAPESVAPMGPEPPYTEFARDIVRFRKVRAVSGGERMVRASSPDACIAAGRLFQNIDFVGWRRDEALNLLGAPGILNDYGVKAGTRHDSPLVYRVDSGWGGWEHVLELEDDVVVRYKARSLD